MYRMISDIEQNRYTYTVFTTLDVMVYQNAVSIIKSTRTLRIKFQMQLYQMQTKWQN